jgi:putative ABC transport system substrate-binding protein
MAIHFRRREFIVTLGGAAATLSLAALAQQGTVPVVGFLSPSSRDFDEKVRLSYFRDGLKGAGYIEGRNLAIEYRGAENHYERLPELAADLLRHQVAVIVAAGGPPVALAAKTASKTIPVVFTVAGDPVALGLVSSYNRPGGNVTGISLFPGTILEKQFEALHQVVPPATVMGCLLNPVNPNVETLTREAQDATRKLGRKLEVLHARNATEIESVFANIVQKRVGALVVTPDGLFFRRSEHLVALSAHHMLPTIFAQREVAMIGGLMSYGINLSDTYRQAAIYTAKILKGAHPGDLPVFQMTKVDLVINLKTAKALGLTIPATLLARADEVIE